MTGLTAAQSTLADLSLALVYASLGCLLGAGVAFALTFARSVTPTQPVAVLVGAGTVGAPVDSAVEAAAESTGGPADRGRLPARIGMALTWLATVLLAIALVTRALSAGRAPWGNMYEFALAGAAAALIALLVVGSRRDVRWLGLWVVVPVALLLGLAVSVLYTESGPLVPALHSAWLVVHVGAAIVAFGAFTVGTAAALLMLIAQARPWFAARLPQAARLDALSYRCIAFAFPIWTFAVVAGAIWAESAWGRYWGWDPKETWSLIVWVLYAGYLHARVTAGWRGGRAAILAFLGYTAMVFNFFGVNILIPGLHSYSGL